MVGEQLELLLGKRVFGLEIAQIYRRSKIFERLSRRSSRSYLTRRTGKLIKNVKTAWANISPDILDNLICCMPERIKKCIKVKGGYIGK